MIAPFIDIDRDGRPEKNLQSFDDGRGNSRLMRCSFEWTSASASSEPGGLDPAHRESLNSAYFFTHRRRSSFCRAAIRDRRSFTYSWAIARKPETTWLRPLVVLP